MYLVSKAPSPYDAFKMGRENKIDPEAWDKVKDQVMLQALRLKFTQNQELAKMLLDTEEAYLIEHTKKDKYWGDAGNGTGKNMLGKLLVKVRD
jgi:ribA/ribD-fused uncharacterized protein